MAEIEKIIKIIAELGINELNMCSEIRIAFSTWWRIKNGTSKQPSYGTMVKLMTHVGLIK